MCIFLKRTKTNNEIKLVPSFSEEIDNNSAWCVSFEIAWREFEKNVLSNSFKYVGDSRQIENLIKECEKDIEIDEEDYFAISGAQTIKLKNQIKEMLKTKFNTQSDILDSIIFDENEDTNKILIYSILMFAAEFKKQFDIFPKKAKFGDVKGVTYFGFDKRTNGYREFHEQFEPLFYKSDNDFALSLFTEDNKKIILYRTDLKDDFKTTYKRIDENLDSTIRIYVEKLAIPNLSFNIFKNFSDLLGAKFVRESDNEEFIIENAMQNLKFKLDNKGAKLKSEAAISIMKTGRYDPRPVVDKDYIFDNTFYIFIEENHIPVFALRVDDINLFKK